MIFFESNQSNIEVTNKDYKGMDLPLNIIPKSTYRDMRLVNQQFLLSGINKNSDLILKFKTSNKSERIYLHEIEPVYMTQSGWNKLGEFKIEKNIMTITVDRKIINSSSIRVGFAINDFHYSKYTQIMAETFPLWTDIKRYKTSTGQHFLNYFGIKVEEIFGWIRWVSGEKYLKTADVGQAFKIYEYKIPDIDKEEFKVFTEDGFEIKMATTTRNFFKPAHALTYIMDAKREVIFVKEEIGDLYFIVGNDGDSSSPNPYYLWNTFDEFGLLLDLPRRKGEPNEKYKERLYDVFRYPSGAHKSGLQFAIAKETDLLIKEVWEDDRKPYLVKRGREYLNPHAIFVDYERIQLGEYDILDNGDVLIHPRADKVSETEFFKGSKRIVGYVRDVNAYEIFNKSDFERLKNIYEWDEMYELKILSLMKTVRELSPIMWGYAKWDRSYWDAIDKSYTGVAFMPTYLDSNIKLWRNQKIVEEEDE